MSATTFSYAQAARGRAVSQPSPQQASSPAPSTTGSQGKDDASTGATSVTAPSVVSNSGETRDTEQSIHAQAEGGSSKQESEVSSTLYTSSYAASAREQPGKTAEESVTRTSGARTQTRSQSEHTKGSRSTSRTSRFNDSTDGRKGRKGKKGRAGDKDAEGEQPSAEEPEKEKEPPKPVVLTEAPPPAVNPWAKRMEAQKAAVQAKLGSAPAEGHASSSESKPDSSQEEASARSTVSNGVHADKWAQKKSADGPRPAEQPPRRSGPRGSRAGDKDEKSTTTLPPVADPSSWPDPKSAAEREQPVRKPQEKTDTVEKDGPDEAGPVRKKTWEKLEIVHSVVFETQLPPLRGSKPRGGARGGREAGSVRSNHPASAGPPSGPPPSSAANSANDKTPSPVPSAAPKAVTSHRPREESVPARATPQTQASHAPKRTSSDAAPRDQRKPSVPGSTTEQARDPGHDATSSSKRASATRDIRTENGALGFEAGQAGARALPQDRNNFPARDGTHAHQYPGREGRPERGRGGGFRGRGGHGGSSSHVASASYAANGHFPAPNGFPTRQNPNSPPTLSGPFPASFGHSSRGRGNNKWSGSGQSAARSSASVPGLPPKAAQLGEFAMPQYPPYMYSPVYDQSVAILKTQVEYYLSVENLCKDYYLRQHMDGQGFAHLSTIAGFKRIRAVTEDLELVRLACSLSDQIEFGVGDDGIERLRIRDKWKLFVLPASERAEPYRNDGPASWTPYVRPDAQFAVPFPAPLVPQPYPVAAAGAFPAFADEQMYSPTFVNGAAYDPTINGAAVLNGHHHGPDSRLSAGVPEYAPPESPVTLESMTNFSDSQVENLMMVLSYEEKDGAGASDAAGVAGYVSQNSPGTESGSATGAAEAQSENKEGAIVSAGPVALNEAGRPEAGIVWVAGQASSSPKEQRHRKPYREIRQAALQQRQEAHPGQVPREMQKLYKFWSQMLLHDFNAKVYQEFRDLAMEDASREPPLRCGLRYLLEFYDKLLLKTNTRKPWPQGRAVPEIFTAHRNEAAELDRKLGAKDIAAN